MTDGKIQYFFIATVAGFVTYESQHQLDVCLHFADWKTGVTVNCTSKVFDVKPTSITT